MTNHLFKFLLVVLAAVLSACTQAEPRQDGVSVAMDTVNFNADRGIMYALYDISAPADDSIDAQYPLDLAGYNPVGGGMVDALYSGGSRECCLNLPASGEAKHYILKWTEYLKDGTEQHYSETLTLGPYQTAENVFIVFLENHKAELVMGGGYPDEAGWRGSIKGGTLGACMAKHSKAHCYTYLPHYENEHDKFAEWTRMDCRHILAGHPEKAVTFAFSKQDCLDWERECLAGITDKGVTDKNMCHINWRSPEWGE